MINIVCKLLKALYSLKQAPRLQQKKLSNVLKELGFEPYTSDQCVYINQKTGILIITYVNDILVLGKNARKIKELKRAIVSKFEIEDLGLAKYFLGVRITRNREKGTITLT